MLEKFTHSPRVAYFSMEIALRNEIPTYAGGLCVLFFDLRQSVTPKKVIGRSTVLNCE